MAKLGDKVENALSEARILVLGMQVLVGFEYRAFLEEGFRELPRWAQLAKTGGLAAMLLAILLILFPSAWHRLAERGEDTPRMHELTRGVLLVALVPVAAGLALDVLVATVPIAGGAAAVAAAAAVTVVAAVFWYGLEGVVRARRHVEEGHDMEQGSAEEKVQQKIRHVLTEARMVLPGAQALLGFQLAATLVKGFSELPQAAKLVHLAAILLTATAVILLMAPAAYHRIVERGEQTEDFHRVASGLVVAATVPLAAALAAETAIVSWRVIASRGAAIGVGLGVFAALLAAWIAVPLAARARRASAYGWSNSAARGMSR